MSEKQQLVLMQRQLAKCQLSSIARTRGSVPVSHELKSLLTMLMGSVCFDAVFLSNLCLPV